MESWVKVADRSEVPPGRAKRVNVAGNDVALFNIDGQLFAAEDQCPEGGRLSQEATVGEGTTITCRGRQYDLASGQCLDGGQRLRTYPVRVGGDGDEVLVRI